MDVVGTDRGCVAGGMDAEVLVVPEIAERGGRVVPSDLSKVKGHDAGEKVVCVDEGDGKVAVVERAGPDLADTIDSTWTNSIG